MSRRVLAVFAISFALAAPAPAAALDVASATYWPIGSHLTFVSWPTVPGASGYRAIVNGSQVALELSAPRSFIDSGRIEATIGNLLGPADTVEISALNDAGVAGAKLRASYATYDYVFIPDLNLQFAENKTAPDAAALARIRAFAQLVAQHGFTRIVVIGHDAGPVGAADAYRFGQLRARAAAAAIGKLVTVRTTTSSLGNSAPLESNATAGGRAVNRRVELGLR